MWSYSPRQIKAFSFLAHKRTLRENHRMLQLYHLASSGDGEAITKQLTQWEKETD